MERKQLKEKLALASRILYNEGHGDLHLGHISARLPGEKLVYMKPSGFGLEEIGPEDIIALDFDGNKVEGLHQVHGEWPIHTEIYQARHDVNAVIHTHPLYATAFCALKKPFPLISQDAVVFYEGLPFFDETPALITNKEMGKMLAQKLGSARAVLMANHGITVVGSGIEEAVCLAVHLEKAMKTYFIVCSSGEEL
ncbi:MAG TPA: class II aldolase/adducin family protein, partial [Firmicutes bacterium]|nr:class II aldolase/adducin family protein [Bacillota bacterium]